MEKKELFLLTVFCCMACDGDIAKEEIGMIKDYASKTQEFEGLDIPVLLDGYIEGINTAGVKFLNRYLSKVAEAELSEDEQLHLLDLAMEMIEADNIIQYSEVKFFKKIRSRLSVSDEKILEKHPDKEDFLLPDINVAEDPVWDENILFSKIQFDLANKK